MHTFIIQHVSCAFKVYGGKRTIFNILAVHSKYVVDRARLEIKISHFIPPSHRDKSSHYYKNVDLSRLGNRCCPGFPTGNACPGQKGGALLSRVWQPGQKRTYQPGQKVQPAPTWLAHPFVPVGVIFFSSCFSFLNYFSISIILLHFN